MRSGARAGDARRPGQAPSRSRGSRGLALLFAAACTRDLSLLRPVPVTDATTGDAGFDLPDGADAAGPDVAPDGSLVPSCQGLGDPVRFMTTTGLTCAATIAARTHRAAICSCSDWNALGSVTTQVPFGATPAPAGIAVNGSLTSSNDMTVPGSVWVAGARGASVTGQFSATGSFRSAGPITFTGPTSATVGGDVYAGGGIIGPAKIGGTLHLPSTAVVGPATAPAAVSREPVTVSPPCDCTPPFDIGAAIAAAMATNDNAAHMISADHLANVTMTAALDLPCGVYYLSSISAQQGVTLQVHGHVLLAIGGDVLLQKNLFIGMDPGAELDILVGGSFTANVGMMTPVGTMMADLVRLWVKGPGPIVLPNWPFLGAIVFAPNSALMAPHGLSVVGAVLAGSISIGGTLSFTYTDAVLSGGTVCGDPKVDPLP